MRAETNSFNFGNVKVIIGKYASEKCASELTNAEKKKPLLVSDRGIEKCGILKIVKEGLDEAGIAYEEFLDVEPDPSEETILSGLEIFRNKQCDSVIGVGGGSVMDVAKCIRLLDKNEGRIFDYDNSGAGTRKFRNRGELLILIPTTAGTGSEGTPYAVVTNREEERKATITSNFLVADVAILDPMLTLKLPKHITASTGLDALAHAIGAYTSGRVLNAAGDTTYTDMVAYHAIQMIAENLPKAYDNGDDLEARKKMQLASFMAASVACVGSDGSHGLGHALGGIYHVPHGFACAVVMPYILEYNLEACPQRMKDIAVAFGEDVEGLDEMEAAGKAVEAVKKLMAHMNMASLKDFVGDFEKKEKLIQASIKEKCSALNPKELTYEAIEEIYTKAYER